MSSFPGLTNSLPYASLRQTLNTQANGTHHNSIGNVLNVTNGPTGVSLSSVLLVSNLSEQVRSYFLNYSSFQKKNVHLQSISSRLSLLYSS